MAYVVQFQITGIQKAIADLQKLAQAAQQAQANIGAGVAGTGGTRGGGGTAGNTAASQAAQAMRQQAQMMRAQAQLINAQTALANAMKRASGGSGGRGGLGSKIWAAVLSSRVGITSHGVTPMPLVSKLLPIMAELGPVGWAAAAGLGAVLLALKSMEYGVSFAQTKFVTGGTFDETARLGAVGAAAGIGLGDMGGIARQYSESLKSNPYAAGVANAHGYAPNYAGVFGDLDDAKRLLGGLKDLLDPKRSDASARRLAYGTPLEQFGWMRNASAGVKQQMLDTTGNAQTPDQLRRAADAQIMMNIELSKFMLTIQELGSMVLPIINFQLQIWLDSLKGAKAYFLELYIGWYEFIHFILNSLGIKGPDRPVSQYEELARLKGEKEAQQAKALDRNTDALNNNARALDNNRHIYNGGYNAEHAIPGKYFQPNNWDATRMQVTLGQIPI